jgi:hypothetical protein
MPISTLTTPGPTIPAGATSISLKDIETAGATPKEDVTALGDSTRVYAAPPLVEAGTATATKTVSVSGNLKSDTTLALTAAATVTGWICESYEKSYEVGKYATYSVEFSFYPST